LSFSIRFQAALLAALLSSCGGGGGGGSSVSPTTISGSIVIPGGVLDGTLVDLIEFDASSSAVQRIGQTRAVNGRYSIDLARFGRVIEAGLAVRVGSGADELTALIFRAETDLEPLSQALTQLYREGSRPGITLEELTELDESLRFLCGARGIEELPVTADTVALMTQTATADAGFMDFLAAARGAGRTDEGPGDLADYFADELNEVSAFLGSVSRDSGPATFFSNARRVRVENSAGTRTIEELNPYETGRRTEIFQETSRALTLISSPDPRDALAAEAIPYDELRFPLVVGRSWTQFDVQGIRLPTDYDGDGTRDTLEAIGTRTLLGFETRTVIAGAFPNCIHLQSVKDYTLVLSDGGTGQSKVIEDEWYAPGVGLIERATLTTTDLQSLHQQAEFHEELTAWQANGDGYGILPSWPLAQSIQVGGPDLERPGRPALASNGEEFLLVTQRFEGGRTILIGVRVSASGVGELEFELTELAAPENGGPAAGAQPVVAYDGRRFVVAYESNGEIFALSTTIDGLSVSFPVQLSGLVAKNSHPTIAFNGQECLVAWTTEDELEGRELHGRRIASDALLSEELLLHSAAGDPLTPALTHAGGVYWMAWADQDTREVQGKLLDLGGIGIFSVDLLTISDSPEEDFDPIFSFDGQSVLVVWSESEEIGQQDGNTRLMARRFTPAGEPLEAPFVLAELHRRLRSPTVAFDGEYHLVSWWIDDLESSSGIRMVRVTPEGVRIDGPSTQPGLGVDVRPNPTRLAVPVAAAAGRRVLIAYLVNRELAGQTKDISSALVYPF